MGFEPKEGKPALHCALRHAFGLGHQANAPSIRMGGLLLQRTINHLGHFLVIVRSGPSRTQLVVEPLQATVQEPAPPFAYGGRGYSQRKGNRSIGVPSRAGQNGLRSLNHAVGHSSGFRQGDELVSLLIREN